MNRRNRVLTIVCLLAFCFSATAQDNKPKVEVGGLFFMSTYYDTYKSVDSREGVSYSYPLAPNINEKGKDLNQVGQFGMSPYQTRLYVALTGFKLLNADAKFFVETDFMGASSSFFQMVRLRHAYLDLKWEKDELLFGQTNNLEMVDKTISGLLTAGAGSPITILERPIMIRYGRRLTDRWKAYAAVSFHHVQVGDAGNAETYAANRNAGLPSFEGRLQYESPNGQLFAGVGGGYKMMRPRVETKNGAEATEVLSSGSVTAFLRTIFNNGYTLKIQGIYGSNLTHLGMAGGYARLYYEEQPDDYEYTNFIGASGWIDLESRSYNKFYYGIFGGWMQNLGTGQSTYPDESHVFARDPGLQLTGRVSPRVTYQYQNLLLGLEYSLFFSRWGAEFNSHYLPVKSHDVTYNNRILFLVRYAF